MQLRMSFVTMWHLIAMIYASSVCESVCVRVRERVGECGGVLRCCILRPMGGSVAQDHENGPMGVHPLRRPEVVNAVICDQVCQVVLSIERRQDA